MAPINISLKNRFSGLTEALRPRVAFLGLILMALVAFEIFNFSTTEHALKDLLGGLNFMGLKWSTVLAIAFCGIDFAGIARLFTPEQGADEPREVWYLFGAWLLAATMNAILTWWGVAMAIATHDVQSTMVIDPGILTKAVPVFVSVMVWVIRILIIGTLSQAFDHAMWANSNRAESVSRVSRSMAPAVSPHAESYRSPALTPSQVNLTPTRNPTHRPAYNNRAGQSTLESSAPVSFSPSRAESSLRPEPTYHSLSMSGRGGNSPAKETGNTNNNRSARL